MDLTRRGFFKASALALAGSMAYELSSASEAFAMDADDSWKLVNTEEYTNICCYCSGGCGVICSVRDGELINIEGDPDHVINEGGLCPKGATMFQLFKEGQHGKQKGDVDKLTDEEIRDLCEFVLSL